MTYEALLHQATAELREICADLSATRAHCIQEAYELAETYQRDYPELVSDPYLLAEILLVRLGF